jgi:hypothetical protein
MRAKGQDERLTPIRNLFRNPRGVTSNGAWWSFNPGIGGALTRTTTSESGTGFARGTWTSQSTQAGGHGFYFMVSGTTASRVLLPAGDKKAVFWSAMVRCSVDATFTLSLEHYDAVGTRINPNTTGATFVVPAGVWTKVYASAHPLPGTVLVTPTVYCQNVAFPVGTTLDARDGMVVQETGLYDYGVPADWKWLGAADNSESVTVPKAYYPWKNMLTRFQSTLELPNVGAGATGFTNQYNASWLDSSWAEGGSRSFAQRSNVGYTGNDIYTSVGGDISALRMGMQAGKTYTFIGTIRLDSPTVASALGFGANAVRALTFWSKVGAGGYTVAKSASADNVAGVTRLSVTFTVPVGATEAFLRLYHGGDHTSGPIWWDRLGLFEHNEFGAPPASYWVPGLV